MHDSFAIIELKIGKILNKLSKQIFLMAKIFKCNPPLFLHKYAIISPKICKIRGPLSKYELFLRLIFLHVRCLA